jgi:hypothetical protein
MMPASGELELGLKATREILAGSEEQALEVFDRLRRQKMLAASMHEINKMLLHPAHAASARAALRRIGMEHSG